MRSRSALQLRSAVFAAAAALALGLAACGDSDDSSGGGGSGSGASSGTAGGTSGGSAAGGSDRDQARATVEGLYSALADRDAKGVCEQLNPAMQKQFAEGAGGAKTGSCEESFQQLMDKADEDDFAPATKAKVLSVSVKGDEAVAKVSFGSKGSRSQVPLKKVEGEWKLEAAATAPAPSKSGK